MAPDRLTVGGGDMPTFEVVPATTAQIEAATGKRAERLREYLGYIEQIGENQAGKLEAVEGETPTAVRRKLTVAAKATGKELVVMRTGDVVYFWEATGKRGKSKRR